MPIYVYRILRDKPAGEEDDTFEIRQGINDPPLEYHPITHERVERVITAPSISVNKLGNAAINSSGLTKYVKTSDGTYERQAGGQGPKIINPHD